MKWLPKIAEYAAILAVLFWGVPYYIDRQVEDRMIELAQNPEEAPAIIQLVAKVDGVEQSISRLEDEQVATRGEISEMKDMLIDYFQRQADQ